MYYDRQPLYSENPVVYEICVERCGRAGQATDGNIIRLVRFAWCLTEGTETHSEYVIQSNLGSRTYFVPEGRS